MYNLRTCTESKMLECFGMDDHDDKIRADERAMVLDKLENKLRIWDHGVNAIPIYVWNCIEEMKN